MNTLNWKSIRCYITPSYQSIKDWFAHHRITNVNSLIRSRQPHCHERKTSPQILKEKVTMNEEASMFDHLITSSADIISFILVVINSNHAPSSLPFFSVASKSLLRVNLGRQSPLSTISESTGVVNIIGERNCILTVAHFSNNVRSPG